MSAARKRLPNRRVSVGITTGATLPACITMRNPRLAAAWRDTLLDACWDASGIHNAATVAAFIDFLVSHIRQHPRYDALDLGRVVRWLEGLRAWQSDDATLVVGRSAVNRIIDKIVDAYDAGDVTTTTSKNFTGFPARGRDYDAAYAAKQGAGQ